MKINHSHQLKKYYQFLSMVKDISLFIKKIY